MLESVAHELGIDPERMEWQDWAACKNMPLDLFFDGYEKGSAAECKAIDSLCNSCEVQKLCGDYAQSQKQEGVWGGLYWTSTGKVDPKKNAHKTDEDWKRLSQVYGKRMKPRGSDEQDSSS